MSASNKTARQIWTIGGEYQISGGVNIVEDETRAEILPAKVYYYFPNQRNTLTGCQKIWFQMDHGLIFNNAQPLKLKKGTKLNRQVTIGVPGEPYYPFENRKAWEATKKILTSPGIAEIGICRGLLWVVTTRRYRERQTALLNLKASVKELVRDVSGREAVFVDAGWYRIFNQCHWHCRPCKE